MLLAIAMGFGRFGEIVPVLLVGLLNYVTALALGPVVEHFILWMPKS